MDLAARRVRVQTGDIISTLSRLDVRRLAVADGFANEADFFEYFTATHGQTFAGHLIKWEV